MTEDFLEETYYTIQEIADLLKVSSRTVRNWINEGKLEALRFGREFRIPETALKMMMSNSVVGK